MATKKKISPAYKATAIYVIATIASRCRAGIIFSKDAETRVELDQLPAGALAAIEADPYLKVTYEADELVEDSVVDDLAENRILALENEITQLQTVNDTAVARIKQLELENEQLDKLSASLVDANARIEELNAEIAELKAAASSKAKK